MPTRSDPPGTRWLTEFEIREPLPGLPTPICVHERRVDDDFRIAGRGRRKARFCTFKYTLDGLGHYRGRDGEHELPPGVGILFAADDPAFVHWFSPSRARCWHWLRFSFLDADDMVAALLRRHGHRFVLPGNARLIRQLRAYRSTAYGTCEIERADGLRLVADLLAQLDLHAQGERHEAASQLAAAAKKLIQQHGEAAPSVAELAVRLGVSPEHLARRFRREVGCSPQSYLARQRMRRACALLDDPELSLQTIAARLGFAGNAQFSRAFKRERGLSPSEYRRSRPGPLPD